MKVFKVIVAGGRNFKDYQSLKSFCDYTLKNKTRVEVICGGARGADKLGERYAKERNLNIHYFLPDWKEKGKSAGYFRNVEMAKNADALIAFWDGKSFGTKMMIEIAKIYKLKIRIKKY